MSTLPKNFISPEQYLEIERATEFRNEFFDGTIRAMQPSPGRHGLIIVNLVAALHGQFHRRDCRVFAVQMRVTAPGTPFFAYPDVIAICGNREFLDHERDTLLNPTLIIEVMTAASEGHDRGARFEHYERLSSLRQYLLVDSERVAVEVFTRQSDGGWLLHRFVRLEDTAALDSIGCHLPLAVVYEDVEFETGQPPI